MKKTSLLLTFLLSALLSLEVSASHPYRNNDHIKFEIPMNKVYTAGYFNLRRLIQKEFDFQRRDFRGLALTQVIVYTESDYIGGLELYIGDELESSKEIEYSPEITRLYIDDPFYSKNRRWDLNLTTDDIYIEKIIIEANYMYSSQRRSRTNHRRGRSVIIQREVPRGGEYDSEDLLGAAALGVLGGVILHKILD